MYVQESYGKNVKSLTKAQEDSVHCISVTYQFDPLRVEACQIGQAWLPFSECVFATAYDFLIIHVPGYGFQVSCSITFLMTEVKLTSMQFPRSSFLTFLKIGVAFVFPWSSGTFPFAMIKQRFPRVASKWHLPATSCGCIPSGPVNFLYAQFT